MTRTRIRAYRADDRAACHHVFYRAVHEGAAAFYDADQRAAWAPSAQPDLSKPDKLLDQWCWIAEGAEGGVIGFMSLRRDGYLDVAFVLPEAQGTGVANALLDALIARARAEGLTRLTVHASHLARRFFAKHGWQVDHAEAHPARGQTLERFAMSLMLKQKAAP